MSLFTSFQLSSAGLHVERRRLDVAAENLANIHTTQTPQGGPYQKKELKVVSKPVDLENESKTFLKKESLELPSQISVQRSKTPPLEIYDPRSPDANEKGFVLMPNISTSQEMVNLMDASMAYEANLNVFNEAKTLVMKTLDLGGV